MPLSQTMIKAERVGGYVVYYPMRWVPALHPSKGRELVPLMYDGCAPKGFETFGLAEEVCLRYQNPDPSISCRWDVDAGNWGSRWP